MRKCPHGWEWKREAGPLGVGHRPLCSWQGFTYPGQDAATWREAQVLKLTETWEAPSSVRKVSQPTVDTWTQSGLPPEPSDLEKPGVIIES